MSTEDNNHDNETLPWRLRKDHYEAARIMGQREKKGSPVGSGNRTKRLDPNRWKDADRKFYEIYLAVEGSVLPRNKVDAIPIMRTQLNDCYGFELLGPRLISMPDSGVPFLYNSMINRIFGKSFAKRK